MNTMTTRNHHGDPMGYKITKNLKQNLKMLDDLQKDALVRKIPLAVFLLSQPAILKLMFPAIPKDHFHS